MLRLIEQGPGLSVFPFLIVGSSKREVDSGVRESLLHFSGGKEPLKEVERVKGKRNENKGDTEKV